MHKLLYPIFKFGYTQALACSKLAGDWIFGTDNYIVLPNAIDLKRFQFNPNIRKEFRDKLKIDDDTLVPGHVGNFNEQKNHEFLIKVFDTIQEEHKAVLVLIGEGPLLKSTQEKISKSGISDKVNF